jgi:hypothetical protein
MAEHRTSTNTPFNRMPIAKPLGEQEDSPNSVKDLQSMRFENHLSPLQAKMTAQQAQIRAYLSSPSMIACAEETGEIVEAHSEPVNMEKMNDKSNWEQPQRAIIYRLSRNGGMALCA